MARIAEYEYSRVELALLTGWTLDYIDGLGILDQEAILQVWEAKQRLAISKEK